MPQSALPKPRGATLASEFRESSRVGPRVWSLVGLALVLCLIVPKFIWVALALWLVFVFPLAVGGLFRWALAEILRKVAASGSATVVIRQPPAAAARTERVITGRVVSPQ